MNIQKALKDDRIMKAVIGMGKEEFFELLEKFTPFVKRVRYKRSRKRKASAGNKKFLTTINHEKGFTPMPLNGTKLDDITIGKITAWVQNGMPD